MPYPKLAKAVSAAHWVFMIALPSVFWMKGHPTAIAVFTVVCWVAVFGNVLWCGCPLTILERALMGDIDADRARPGSFVVRRMKAWFGVTLPTWCVTLALIAFTAAGTWLCYR